jgi:hypothetical protein
MLPLAAVVSKGLLRLSFADQRISGSGRQGPRFRPPGLSPRPLTNSAVISLGGISFGCPSHGSPIALRGNYGLHHIGELLLLILEVFPEQEDC